MNDPKQGEREYFARIGEEGRRHALRKPFGDEHCVQYLLNISAFLSVMRPPPARIVEFGCGSGWLSLILAERGYDVVGVDISPDAIVLAEKSKAERQAGNATFLTADYENVRIDPPADYAIFHDALHHAESEDDALRAAHGALGPRGMLICIEPGDGHSESPSSRRAIAEFGVHEKDMPPRKIIRHARAAGFRRHVVLPWPWFYWASTYRPGYAKGTSTGDLRGRKLLSFWRLVRAFFRTRAQGVVLLWKD
jgi:SAM-dependent methyltransferase